MATKPCALLSASAISLLLFTACKDRSGDKASADSTWKAPAKANDMKNPLTDRQLAVQKGKELYNVYCWSCHGENGYGDGAAGGALGQKPSNFHDEKVRRQSDGSLFWKMSKGKGNMPPFEGALSEQQRWQLVTYIRQLASSNRRNVAAGPPKPLRPDITITHVMNVAAEAVRLLKHPITGDLYYTTFNGDLYKITNPDSSPSSVKILSVTDHGITRLQGAAFLKNSIFLCGNVDGSDKRSTKGRMVKYNLDTTVAIPMTIVFNTVEYGANKTIYDHGWNALAISPDGKYIYANSGARTDHGEVQDNGGLYPNARDNALTGKVFRFPVDAKDLYLEDNEAKLKTDGYIYAEGIRNAYDMDFDGSGNLFAVVNSSDYDNPEDMFWVRQGHHYGFPWVMGGIENPQQYPDWQPDPEKDPFINPFSHSWRVRYFHNDPGFPKIPAGVKFSPGVQNLGPDANEYRGHSGKVIDGDVSGVAVSTFTPHASPLGLIFDINKKLAKEFRGDGFVIRYTSGATGSMMGAFTKEGSDLLHLHLTYDSTMDNYFVRTKRIVEGFREPTDAVLVGNVVYVIEYGGDGGNIWKISLPGNAKPASKKKKAK